VDDSGLERHRVGRCCHVFGLLGAVHMTAGHNALRGSGPRLPTRVAMSRPVISSSAGLSLAASVSSSVEANRSGPFLALNLIHDSLNADFASFGHLDVWPKKDISPPIMNLGNRSGRSDKSKPKTRFKDHVCGPVIRPTVERETWQLQTANFSDVN
jgi:hypothetical protein